MKAIKTYYLGPTASRPSRIKASTGISGQAVIVSCDSDMSGLEMHQNACSVLRLKMGWKNAKMISGAFPTHWVHVFVGSSSEF